MKQIIDIESIAIIAIANILYSSFNINSYCNSR